VSFPLLVLLLLIPLPLLILFHFLLSNKIVSLLVQFQQSSLPQLLVTRPTRIQNRADLFIDCDNLLLDRSCKIHNKKDPTINTQHVSKNPSTYVSVAHFLKGWARASEFARAGFAALYHTICTPQTGPFSCSYLSFLAVLFSGSTAQPSNSFDWVWSPEFTLLGWPLLSG
jgi:hypothetical protein